MVTVESSEKSVAGSSAPSVSRWVEAPLGTASRQRSPHQHPAVVVDREGGLRVKRGSGAEGKRGGNGQQIAPLVAIHCA